jgi:putative ABC transport system permease protein
MAMISVLIFSGMASVWTGLNSKVDAYVEDTDMANLWVRATSITDSDLRKLKDIDGVEQVTRCMSVSFSVADSDSELQVNTVDNLAVTHPLLIEGTPYDQGSKDGIWVDAEYAKEHDIEIGTTLLLDGFSNVAELEVKGTIMSPEYIYYTGSITETVPNYEKYGYAFVSEKGMLRLCPQIVYTQAKISFSQTINDMAFRDIFDSRYISTQDRETYTSFARSSQESEQMQKMAMLFSTVFILLALMTMYTSMVRLVNRQKTLIGTLKALGVSGWSIRLHYAAFGLFISILGGIVGLIAGRYTVSPALIKVKQTTIYLPDWELIHAKESFLLIGIIAACCVFASIWAVQKCLRGMPVEIMRNNIENKSTKSKVSDTGYMAKLSYEWRWTLRNIKENKVRFLMGIVGIMGGMVLMIAGLGVRDAIHNSNEFVFSKQFRYETKAVLATAGMTFNWSDDAQWIQESNIELRTEKQKMKQSVVTVCDKGYMLCFYNDENEEIFLPETGAVISRKLASDMGIRAGDTVEIRVFGSQDWVKLKIVETSKTLSPQAIFITKEAYESLGMTFAPTALLTSSKDAQMLTGRDEVKSVVTIDQQIGNTTTVADSVMSIVQLLIMASVVLSVVILYNLGILSYVERIRDYATMKVLGFYQREIRNIAIRECLLTALIGWLIGLPLGIQFLELYINTISFDTFEWISVVDPSTLVIVSVAIVGVSIAVNLLLSRKVKKIVMVEALKSVE